MMARRNGFRSGGWKAAAAVAFALIAGPAAAQNYPSQIVRLLVPFPAGGGTICGSAPRPELEKSLGQTVIVDNRAGAGGMTGALSVINSPPDGHMFLIGDNATNSLVPAMAKTPPYDPVKDVTAIGLLLEVPNVLIVHPSIPANTAAQFIEFAKSKPGQINYGTAGYGSFSHAATELLNIPPVFVYFTSIQGRSGSGSGAIARRRSGPDRPAHRPTAHSPAQ